jgi:hypothetical protein
MAVLRPSAAAQGDAQEMTAAISGGSADDGGPRSGTSVGDSSEGDKKR